MAKYRIAVIGSGFRSHAHIQCYQYIDNAQVVACCDPDVEKAEKVAAQYHLNAYPDARSMIQAEHPDMVHIVTWPSTRVELVSLVSELKVPLCTVEKPIATAVKDWKALCAVQAVTQTKFAVSHQVRWHVDLTKCQRALSSGELGELKFLDISAGMNIAGQGTHTLNYGRSLAGDPRVARVAGNVFGWEKGDVGHPAPAASEAYLTFENGLRGLWTSGPISPRCGDPSTTWQHVRVAGYADRGRVLYEEFAKWEIVSPSGATGGDYGGMENWGKENVRSQSGFHKAMLNWLENPQQAPGTNLEISLHEWQVVLAMYTSALEHRPIDLAGFEPDDELFHHLEKQLA
jgi:predicted dehydrogenase